MVFPWHNHIPAIVNSPCQPWHNHITDIVNTKLSMSVMVFPWHNHIPETVKVPVIQCISLAYPYIPEIVNSPCQSWYFTGISIYLK